MNRVGRTTRRIAGKETWLMDRDGAKKREKKKISEEGEALANKEEES